MAIVDLNPRATVRIAGHPVQPMLMHFPIVCFLGTLATDLAYWRTADMMWANFSAWLLTAGLIIGAFALLAGLIDTLASPVLRRLGAAWLYLIGTAVILVLSLFNIFVHSRDAYTSVVPEGVIISAVVALIVLINAWLGSALTYRHRLGIVN